MITVQPPVDFYPPQGLTTNAGADWDLNGALAPIVVAGGIVSAINSLGTRITAITTDTTLAGDSNTTVPTEKAVKDYVDANAIATLLPTCIGFGGADTKLTSEYAYTIDDSIVTTSAIQIRTPNGLKLMRFAIDNTLNDGIISTSGSSLNFNLGTPTIMRLGPNTKNVGEPAIYLFNGALNTTFSILPTGDMLLDSSAPNNLIVTANSRFWLNNTASDSFAFLGGGAIGGQLRFNAFANPGLIYAALATRLTIGHATPAFSNEVFVNEPLTCTSQLKIANSPTTFATIFCDSQGYMYLNANGHLISYDPTNLVTFQNTTAASSLSNASVVLAGGLAATSMYTGATTIQSTNANQLTISRTLSQLMTIAIDNGGDCTIDTTGNDLNFSSTDCIHILNTTASTTPITGALVVSGGVGISGSIFASGVMSIVGVPGPQFYIKYDNTNYCSFSMSSGGNLNIDCTGNDLRFSSSDRIHVLNSTASTTVTSGALVVNGGIGCGGSMNVTNSINIIALPGIGVPQLTLYYDVTHNASFTCDASGSLMIDCSGNSLSFQSSDYVHVLNTADTGSPITGAFTVAGGLGVGLKLWTGGQIIGGGDGYITGYLETNTFRLRTPVYKTIDVSNDLHLFSGAAYGAWQTSYAMWLVPKDGRFTFNLRLPENWVAGTSIIPTIGLMKSTTALGEVHFQLDVKRMIPNTLDLTTFMTIMHSDFSGGYVDIMKNFDFGAITMAAPYNATPMTLICSLWRSNNVIDTYPDSIWLATMGLKVQIDKLGT